jgi:hypothetical protein
MLTFFQEGVPLELLLWIDDAVDNVLRRSGELAYRFRVMNVPRCVRFLEHGHVILGGHSLPPGGVGGGVCQESRDGCVDYSEVGGHPRNFFGRSAVESGQIRVQHLAHFRSGGALALLQARSHGPGQHRAGLLL